MTMHKPKEIHVDMYMIFNKKMSDIFNEQTLFWVEDFPKSTRNVSSPMRLRLRASTAATASSILT